MFPVCGENLFGVYGYGISNLIFFVSMPAYPAIELEAVTNVGTIRKYDALSCGDRGIAVRHAVGKVRLVKALFKKHGITLVLGNTVAEGYLGKVNISNSSSTLAATSP